jgi:hypothetical protein
MRSVFIFGIILVVLAITTLTACGCGSGPWVNITATRVSPKVAGFIRSFAYDYRHDLLFATTADRYVLRCAGSDTDPRWTPMVGGYKLEGASNLCYDPGHNVLYAASGSGVYSWAAPEGQSTWKTTNGVGQNFCLAYDPTIDVLYAGTRAGVYRCTNPSTSPAWADTVGGIEGATTGSLLFDQSRHVLFAATDTQGIGVWKYQGGTWTNLDPDFRTSKTIGSVASLCYDPARDILYAVNGRFGTGWIMRCRNATTAPSWSKIASPSSLYFGPMVFDQPRDVLYAGAYIPIPPDIPLGTKEELTTPKRLENSHGVFACAHPDVKPEWTNTGGVVSSKDIAHLLLDTRHGALYASAVLIEQGDVWLYETRAGQK